MIVRLAGSGSTRRKVSIETSKSKSALAYGVLLVGCMRGVGRPEKYAELYHISANSIQFKVVSLTWSSRLNHITRRQADKFWYTTRKPIPATKTYFGLMSPPFKLFRGNLTIMDFGADYGFAERASVLSLLEYSGKWPNSVSHVLDEFRVEEQRC